MILKKCQYCNTKSIVIIAKNDQALYLCRTHAIEELGFMSYDQNKYQYSSEILVEGN